MLTLPKNVKFTIEICEIIFYFSSLYVFYIRRMRKNFKNKYEMKIKAFGTIIGLYLKIIYLQILLLLNRLKIV